MNITLQEVFEAYFTCRKTKRYSKGALAFEFDYESKLIELYEDLRNGTYEPGQSTCFIITKPVRREVFAAPFRDRIVHHILINRLNPYFEKYFIHDSYACRVGKGTLAATKRVEHFIRSVSQNGSKKAYGLKLDIKGFFMNINKNILYDKLITFIEENYSELNSTFEKSLCKKIIYNNPCEKCIKKSSPSDWKLLPKDKSLFTAKPNCGLPIGNLTSQVFANFYLSSFDHFIKHTLKYKYYVRYVDDFVIFDSDKTKLKKLIPLIELFLRTELKLTLHPKKIYLQEVSKGVEFLGVHINPYYSTRSKRVKKSFVECINRYNQVIHDVRPDKMMRAKFRASINSYLGILRHYKSYNFRTKSFMNVIDSRWAKFFLLSEDGLKLLPF